MNKQIINFLISAKKNTYAGNGAEIAFSRITPQNLCNRENNFLYYDTYLGSEKFAGEEAVLMNKNQYWCMNYAGKITGEHCKSDFCKAAVLHVSFEKPFRIPENYTNGDDEYAYSIVGEVDWFHGKETIRFKNKELYECYFHRSLIK